MAGIENADDIYEIDPQFFRPCEVDYLCGDSTKARRDLGWEQEYSFEKLVEDMLRHDCGGRADLVKSASACTGGTSKKCCRSTNNTREKFDQQSKDGFGFYTGK
jgi:UDP-glucose 4-epimerase